MAFLFNVRRPDGKLAAQCTSRKLAAREIKWLTTSGFAGPYLIERIERKDCARWGYGLPNRFAAKWPPTKLLQFGKYYLRGDRVIDLADYFGTNVAVVCKMARRLGFGYRIDDPRTFERHRGRWTGREDELINHMYDTEISLGEISENIPRTVSAITQRLRDTAPDLSERSKFGRFIVKGRHRAISPVLESPGSFTSYSEDSGGQGTGKRKTV